MHKIKLLPSIALVTTGLLAGCQSNLQRIDGVTAHAGEAAAANELKMVEDPWRRKAYNTHQHTDSERVSRGVSKYKAGTTGESSSATSASAPSTGG